MNFHPHEKLDAEEAFRNLKTFVQNINAAAYIEDWLNAVEAALTAQRSKEVVDGMETLAIRYARQRLIEGLRNAEKVYGASTCLQDASWNAMNDAVKFLDGAARGIISAPEPKRTYAKDDLVKKKGDKGQWHGKVVGFYSTSCTPEGYAVESLYEEGSVQIYPVTALEPWNAPERVEGWQPIETAPRDGTKILLWWETCRNPVTGKFVYNHNTHRENWLGDGWLSDGDQCLPRNQEDCTRWMPLLAPPALTEKK